MRSGDERGEKVSWCCGTGLGVEVKKKSLGDAGGRGKGTKRIFGEGQSRLRIFSEQP